MKFLYHSLHSPSQDLRNSKEEGLERIEEEEEEECCGLSSEGSIGTVLLNSLYGHLWKNKPTKALKYSSRKY